MVYEKLYGPLGDERHDWLTAKICLTIVEMMRNGGKKPRLKDFMPGWDRQLIQDDDTEDQEEP